KNVTIDLNAERTDYARFVKMIAADGIKMPDTLEDSITTTVAHELAHGVGVHHHGYAGNAVARVTEVTSDMKEWLIYDRSGAPITTRPVLVSGRTSVEGTDGVGAPGNSSSGDVDCIICYVNVYAWSFHLPKSGKMILYRVPVLPNGKIFCKSANGTGINKPYELKDGRSSPGLFGAAATDRGNCLGQMCVRDPK